MPDKGNFEAVITHSGNTHPCITKQLCEQSGQDLGQPGALVAMKEATIDCRNSVVNPELSGTLQSKNGGVFSELHKSCVGEEVITIDYAAFNQGVNALYDPQISVSQTNPTIIAKRPNAICHKQETNEK